MPKTADPVTVVIPVHNAADRLDRVTGWRLALEKLGRGFEIVAVDDGSTDGTADKLAAREPKARLLRHETRKGFGACLRTALAEARVRGALAAQSVAHILDQRRRAQGAPIPLEPCLSSDPRVRDLVVTPHALERYDQLGADAELDDKQVKP